MDEPATAILPSAGTSAERPTELMGGFEQSNESAGLKDSLNTSGVPRFSTKYWAVGGIALLVIGALFAVYWPRGKDDREIRTLQIERLTTSGRSTSAAISPDGKYVIYGTDEGGKDSLWLRQVTTSSNVQIFPASEDVFYWGLTFTPDSDYVNFVKAELEKNVSWGLSQMPVLGGAQKEILKGVEGPVSYSPDGKQFAFVRDEYPTAQESSLMIANADGTGERVLASRKAPETFLARQTGPAWSPDGKTVACIIADETTLISEMGVVEVDVSDGSVRPVRTQAWKYINQLAWLRDKSGLLVLGSDRASSSYASQIWFFSYPDGRARRITTDFHDYRSMSLNTDSSILVTVQSSSISNIWSATGGDVDRAVQIRSGGNNEEGIGGLSLAPDGRVVFYSRASGGDDIWIMNADGSSPRQLTTGTGASFHSRVSPDGRYIVFASVRSFQVNIWRMKIDGSELTQLTTGNGDYEPSVSPDSRWVVYTSQTSGKSFLWKVPIEGGQPVRVTDFYASSAQVSPDGRSIACSYRKNEDSTWRYAIIPFEGGEPSKVFDLVGKKGDFRWSPDSKSIYYLRDTQGGVTNIWNLPLPEGEPRQVTHFKTETIFDFAWSVDGKQLVMSRGTNTSDVVLLRGF